MRSLCLSRICFGLLIGLLLCTAEARAQFGPTGANHPELTWTQIETEHFLIVHHQGLDSVAQEAARMAEEVYHVVTTNLHEPLPGRTRIYLSEVDEVRNAFAFKDDFIFVWMRGILDDNPYSIRASGTSKWLRSVLTHEFTHIVVAHASRDWSTPFFPIPDVPRWFNEGLARYMEPDGWTEDLDMVLRVSAVSSELNFNLDENLGGVLMYEGGQSLVRYIAANYGDSALVQIIHRTGLTYDFLTRVSDVTHHSISEIYDDWHKTVNVYYNSQYGQKDDIKEFSRELNTGLAVIGAARLNPDGKHIAIIGKRYVGAPTKLFLYTDDSVGQSEVLCNDVGLEPSLAWSPDGKDVFYSKMRFGSDGDQIHDLYRVNIVTKESTRITSDSHYTQPDCSPKGDSIVAVRSIGGTSDLVIVPLAGGAPRTLLNLHGTDAQVYFPRFSPDGKEVAFSIFSVDGMRDIGIVEVVSGAVRMVTHDSINDRYAVWSPSGDSLMFVSFANGIPNAYRVSARGASTNRSAFRQVTDVASNIMTWDWAAKKDSILVSSFKSKQSLQLFWISASRTVKSAPPPTMKDYYTKWQSMHMPLVTRPREALPPTAPLAEESYNSLMHIAPVVLLPSIGTDISGDGKSIGLRWGLATLLLDEMGKHKIAAYVDYGVDSRRLGYSIFYQNSQLRPDLSFEVGNFLAFDGVIEDKAYYQVEQNYGVSVEMPFKTPDALNKSHTVKLRVQQRTISAWNKIDFESVPDGRRPIDAKLFDLSLGYAFVSPDFQTGESVIHSDRKFGSDLSYTRYVAAVSYQLHPIEYDDYALALRAKAMAQEGDELPQDFFGFTPYDAFEGGLNLAALPVHDRLRGIRRYFYGNRTVLGSAELRLPGTPFTSLVPLLGLFQPQLALFFDIGSVWYATEPSNNHNVNAIGIASTTWSKTAGAELRSGYLPNVSIGLGVGWELVQGSKVDLYVRVTGSF